MLIYSADYLGKEYCIYERFEAECSSNDVIVMKSAMYGFMGTGRCVKHDFGKILLEFFMNSYIHCLIS